MAESFRVVVEGTQLFQGPGDTLQPNPIKRTTPTQNFPTAAVFFGPHCQLNVEVSPHNTQVAVQVKNGLDMMEFSGDGEHWLGIEAGEIPLSQVRLLLGKGPYNKEIQLSQNKMSDLICKDMLIN